MSKNTLIIAVLILAACGGIISISPVTGETGQSSSDNNSVQIFKATGNEPFWAVEIFYDSLIKFNSICPEEWDFGRQISRFESESGLERIMYSGNESDPAINVEIKKEKCTDTMSGEISPYSVIVSLNREVDDTVFNYRGCGSFTGNYRLNGRWILKKANGEPIEMPDSRDAPYMEINLLEETVSGYGGCNRFHGRAFLENGRITVSKIISTKMYCFDTQEIEDMFLDAITDRSFQFSFDNCCLFLSEGSNRLTFNKAE